MIDGGYCLFNKRYNYETILTVPGIDFYTVSYIMTNINPPNKS